MVSRTPPVALPIPQSKSGVLLHETRTLGELTEKVNQLAQKTFYAIAQARELKKQRNLSPDEQEGAALSKQILKTRYRYVDNLAYELRCFNRFYAKKLAEIEKLVDQRQIKDSEEYLRIEVHKRQKWLSDTATDGVPKIVEAVNAYNQVVAKRHNFSEMLGVSEAWENALAN